MNGAAHRRDELQRHPPALHILDEAALWPQCGTRHEQHLVVEFLSQALTRQDRVLLGTAQDQSRNDMDDAHQMMAARERVEDW